MKNFILLFFLLSFCSIQAQNLFQLKTGRTFSTFSYRDSENSKDETLQYNTNPLFGFSYETSLGKLHIIRPELIYREAGAHSIFNQQKINWNLKYLDLNAAYLLKIVELEKLLVFQGIAGSVGYLLDGEQSIGTQYFNLKNEKRLKTIDLGVQFLAGTKIKVFENCFINIEYRYGLGIHQIENNQNQTQQSSRNRYHGIVSGICFPL